MRGVKREEEGGEEGEGGRRGKEGGRREAGGETARCKLAKRE